MVEVREVVGEDGVAVLVAIVGYFLDEFCLGGVLHVECERQQEPAQFLVYPREVDQLPEVELGILAVVLAAHPFGKEHAVRREAEVVVLLGEASPSSHSSKVTPLDFRCSICSSTVSLGFLLLSSAISFIASIFRAWIGIGLEGRNARRFSIILLFACNCA